VPIPRKKFLPLPLYLPIDLTLFAAGLLIRMPAQVVLMAQPRCRRLGERCLIPVGNGVQFCTIGLFQGKELLVESVELRRDAW